MRIKTALIGFKNGAHHLGSDGILFTEYKSSWRLERLAADFAGANDHDTVYIVRCPLYDPGYSDMDTLDYAKKYGKMIYSKMEAII